MFHLPIGNNNNNQIVHVSKSHVLWELYPMNLLKVYIGYAIRSTLLAENHIKRKLQSKYVLPWSTESASANGNHSDDTEKIY